MKNPIIKYDQQANAIYITLLESDASKTLEIDAEVLADVDENGNVVGIELLNVTPPSIQ